MEFKKGDIVGFLHERGKGEVVRVCSPSRVLIKINDGFESDVHIREIYHIKPEENHAEQLLSGSVIPAVTGKDNDVKKIPKKQNKNPDKRMQYLHDEVDLHIGALVDDIHGLSNSEMLHIQIRHFRDSLEKAIDRGEKRIVFIHGEGKGVLKNEMFRILKKFDNVKFQDAPYAFYGHGATEVLIFKYDVE